jgi:hypothetical protein
MVSGISDLRLPGGVDHPYPKVFIQEQTGEGFNLGDSSDYRGNSDPSLYPFGDPF